MLDVILLFACSIWFPCWLQVTWKLFSLFLECSMFLGMLQIFIKVGTHKGTSPCNYSPEEFT